MRVDLLLSPPPHWRCCVTPPCSHIYSKLVISEWLLWDAGVTLQLGAWPPDPISHIYSRFGLTKCFALPKIWDVVCPPPPISYISTVGPRNFLNFQKFEVLYHTPPVSHNIYTSLCDMYRIGELTARLNARGILIFSFQLLWYSPVASRKFWIWTLTSITTVKSRV